MRKGGYAGKVLRVNLSNQSYSEEQLSEKIMIDYLGGAGFA